MNELGTGSARAQDTKPRRPRADFVQSMCRGPRGFARTEKGRRKPEKAHSPYSQRRRNSGVRLCSQPAIRVNWPVAIKTPTIISRMPLIRWTQGR